MTADRCYIHRLVSSPDPTLAERKGLVTIMHEEWSWLTRLVCVHVCVASTCIIKLYGMCMCASYIYHTVLLCPHVGGWTPMIRTLLMY